MDKRITSDNLKDMANEFSLERALVKTVIQVEAAGTGFDDATGLIKIQFEPYYFQKYTRTKILNGVELQPAEWAAYKKAEAIDAEKAMMSTSWGTGQVMGFNFAEAGFATVQQMVSVFKLSEYYQVRGMLLYIKANPVMYKALVSHDWALFAEHYNGPKYAINKYDIKLKAAYLKFTK